MSIPRSQKQNQEQKKHGDKMERALEEADKHSANRDIDPVPAPDDGRHAHSHAAHLGEQAQEHTKAVGSPRHGPPSEELREPAMEISRVGKMHRKQ